VDAQTIIFRFFFFRTPVVNILQAPPDNSSSHGTQKIEIINIDSLSWKISQDEKRKRNYPLVITVTQPVPTNLNNNNNSNSLVENGKVKQVK
jgi:hypothetical protein